MPALSGPSPSISTVEGDGGGRVSRTRRPHRCQGLRAGAPSSTFLAFIRPVMVGYLGSTPPSITVTTAGSGTA